MWYCYYRHGRECGCWIHRVLFFVGCFTEKVYEWRGSKIQFWTSGFSTCRIPCNFGITTRISFRTANYSSSPHLWNFWTIHRFFKSTMRSVAGTHGFETTFYWFPYNSGWLFIGWWGVDIKALPDSSGGAVHFQVRFNWFKSCFSSEWLSKFLVQSIYSFIE